MQKAKKSCRSRKTLLYKKKEESSNQEQSKPPSKKNPSKTSDHRDPLAKASPNSNNLPLNMTKTWKNTTNQDKIAPLKLDAPIES